MANLKSSKKDVRRIEKRRAQSQGVRSSLKTYIRKARESAKAPEEQSTEALRIALKMLDKAAQRGIIHKNQAARRKSRIAKALAKAVA